MISVFFMSSYQDHNKKKPQKSNETEINREQIMERIDSVSTANYAKAAKLDSIFNNKK